MARRLVRAVRSRQGAAHVCRGGLRRAAQARVESAALLAAARASRWRRSVVRDGTSFARARARARSVLDVRRCEATDTKAGRGSRLGGGLDRPAWLMASKGGQQARAMAHAGGGGGGGEEGNGRERTSCTRRDDPPPMAGPRALGSAGVPRAAARSEHDERSRARRTIASSRASRREHTPRAHVCRERTPSSRSRGRERGARARARAPPPLPGRSGLELGGAVGGRELL